MALRLQPFETIARIEIFVRATDETQSWRRRGKPPPARRLLLAAEHGGDVAPAVSRGGDGRSPAERAIDGAVEGEEIVRVEGGAFRTLDIVARFDPTPDLVYEMWYAPAVKQWVRLKEYSPAGVRSRELTDFALR